MARTRKGNPVHGWLLIEKPAGVTSTAVVNKARWAFRAQKAGHAGTLDPAATGLLAIAFGEATKAIPIAQEGLKTYSFRVRLGQSTTTDDAEGELLHASDTRPNDDEIEKALASFRGEIEQTPPQFSAVKVGGERAYDLARDGIEMELQPRPLWVEDLSLIARPDADHVDLQLVCGKGGYVRSIARDLGELLGCFAHVQELRREASGDFDVAGALAFSALDGIRETGDTHPHLKPISAGLAGTPQIEVSTTDAQKLANGNAVHVVDTGLETDEIAWTSLDGTPVAIVTYRAGMLHPDRVFVGLANAPGAVRPG